MFAGLDRDQESVEDRLRNVRRKRELVTSGPYAFVRHPIYAAILLFVAGAVGCHQLLRAH